MKEDNEPTHTKKTEKVKPVIEFMDKWAKEEACYREAIVRDYNTKKIVPGGWPRQKPTEQSAYEAFIEEVVNPDTGEFFPERNSEGIPIKGTGARYVVTVITRVRDQTGKKEYLLSKGALIGFNAAGLKVERHIKYREMWNRQIFANERTYSEKTGAYTVQTIGPSKLEEVYEMPFNPQNVQELYKAVEDENVMFVLKDLKTAEAREVKWSCVKDTLELFKTKSFDYLWKADYMPLPVKMELRQQAVAQNLIGGVASDYSTTTSADNSKGGAYT